MSSAARLIRRFLREDAGPTATEYAFMLAAVVVMALGAISLFAPRLSALVGSLPVPDVSPNSNGS